MLDGIAILENGKTRILRSEGKLSNLARLLAVLSRDHLAEDDWDELEETLLLADVEAII